MSLSKKADTNKKLGFKLRPQGQTQLACWKKHVCGGVHFAPSSLGKGIRAAQVKTGFQCPVPLPLHLPPILMLPPLQLRRQRLPLLLLLLLLHCASNLWKINLGNLGDHAILVNLGRKARLPAILQSCGHLALLAPLARRLVYFLDQDCKIAGNLAPPPVEQVV